MIWFYPAVSVSLRYRILDGLQDRSPPLYSFLELVRRRADPLTEIDSSRLGSRAPSQAHRHRRAYTRAHSRPYDVSWFLWAPVNVNL